MTENPWDAFIARQSTLVTLPRLLAVASGWPCMPGARPRTFKVRRTHSSGRCEQRLR